MQRRKNSNGTYMPFVDKGPPTLSGGALNTELIRTAGVRVPDGHYLVLGDNYAVSSDSRKWGFVPQGNLKGVPEFIFWPPGPKMGPPNQPAYPWFTNSRLIVWGIAALCALIWWIFHMKHRSLPIKIPK